MKVFKMNDSEFIAAPDLESATKFLREQCDDEPDEPFELTPEQMLKFKHTGEDGADYENPISFKAELEKNIAEGIEFPCVFASADI